MNKIEISKVKTSYEKVIFSLPFTSPVFSVFPIEQSLVGPPSWRTFSPDICQCFFTINTPPTYSGHLSDPTSLPRHHSSYTVAPHFGSYTQVPTPWLLYLGSYTLALTAWPLHFGSYTLVPTPWLLRPSPYTLVATPRPHTSRYFEGQ